MRSPSRLSRGRVPSTSSVSVLGAALAIAMTIGACGTREGTRAIGAGSRMPAVGVSPSATASPPSASPTSAPPKGSAATAIASSQPPHPPPPVGPMKPIAPTVMEAKLREIGLDPAALPPLDKLDAKTLRDVMNTFTKSLGVQCHHCHEKDFRAPTVKKKIATHMWNDLTRALVFEGSGGESGVLYCDSCHGGHAQPLDRHDRGALADWMQDNYVDKLSRVDRENHGCETCHGDPFEGDIFSARWK